MLRKQMSIAVGFDVNIFCDNFEGVNKFIGFVAKFSTTCFISVKGTPANLSD